MTGIRLVVSDVDGTILNDDKKLTPRTVEAARSLREAGVTLALCSARPPRGMASLIRELGITSPVAAFNGGSLVTPDMRVLRRRSLWVLAVGDAVRACRQYGLDAWVYQGSRWLVSDPGGQRVEWEAECVGFRPEILRHGFYAGLAQKVTGVSDNPGAMARAETAMKRLMAGEASVQRSTPFYLDVTPPNVNKGAALTWLAGYHGIDPSQVAAIGDGENDTRMFARAGLAVAMGNASGDVQLCAHRVTGTNNEDGWAEAVEAILS